MTTLRDTMPERRILETTQLLGALPPDALEMLRQQATTRTIARNEVLFKQDEPSSELYGIISGRIAILTRSPDGRESLVAVLDEGSLFGELGLFDDGPRSADARALEESTLIVLGYDVVHAAIGNLLPNRKDFKDSAAPIARGTFLGALLGLLPGNGAVLGPFASYTLEKKLAKDPSRFGRGAIEGVAGPESANNAGAQTAFIPLLTLGIPPNAVMALMVGAMTIHGIIPGPQVMTKNPALFWGMIASMWIGNLMLLVINLPLIGLWVRFLKVPYRLMFPSIILLCCIGIYSVNNSPTDVVMTAGFGLFGYALIKYGFEPAPLLLAFVLGRLMEEKLRQALVISRGSFWTFVDRPLSGGLLALSLVLVIIAILPSIRKGREEVFADAD